MFECTMPLYHEADWSIWQSMILDAQLDREVADHFAGVPYC